MRYFLASAWRVVIADRSLCLTALVHCFPSLCSLHAFLHNHVENQLEGTPLCAEILAKISREATKNTDFAVAATWPNIHSAAYEAVMICLESDDEDWQFSGVACASDLAAPYRKLLVHWFKQGGADTHPKSHKPAIECFFRWEKHWGNLPEEYNDSVDDFTWNS